MLQYRNNLGRLCQAQRFENTKTLLTIESGDWPAGGNFILPIEYTDFIIRVNAWLEGELIQNAFKTYSPDIREAIMTGICPDEWKQLGEDE